MAIPSWFVIVMGLGTVFIGLICIILLCKILGAFCARFEKKSVAVSKDSVSSPGASGTPICDRQEVIAAIGTAIAEDIGVEVDAIRVVSVKKV